MNSEARYLVCASRATRFCALAPLLRPFLKTCAGISSNSQGGFDPDMSRATVEALETGLDTVYESVQLIITTEHVRRLQALTAPE